jgi:hypothetical protein
MIVIHAVQKLLNISRLKPALYISQAADGQELHSWYARLVSTSFPGKLFVMYVHEPSLMLVLAPGKSISKTLPIFYERLPALLIRANFKQSFIHHEIPLIKEGHVVSKTNSRSMLASMNNLTSNIEFSCSRFSGYDKIDIDEIENMYMDWLTQDKSASHGYRQTSDYWREKGAIQ